MSNGLDYKLEWFHLIKERSTTPVDISDQGSGINARADFSLPSQLQIPRALRIQQRFLISTDKSTHTINLQNQQSAKKCQKKKKIKNLHFRVTKQIVASLSLEKFILFGVVTTNEIQE